MPKHWDKLGPSRSTKNYEKPATNGKNQGQTGLRKTAPDTQKAVGEYRTGKTRIHRPKSAKWGGKGWQSVLATRLGSILMAFPMLSFAFYRQFCLGIYSILWNALESLSIDLKLSPLMTGIGNRGENTSSSHRLTGFGIDRCRHLINTLNFKQWAVQKRVEFNGVFALCPPPFFDA